MQFSSALLALAAVAYAVPVELDGKTIHIQIMTETVGVGPG